MEIRKAVGFVIAVPCNEERSERSERDFTVEKDMGRSCVYYAKPIEVISFKPIKVGL